MFVIQYLQIRRQHGYWISKTLELQTQILLCGTDVYPGFSVILSCLVEIETLRQAVFRPRQVSTIFTVPDFL
jgi:hypothetical protein